MGALYSNVNFESFESGKSNSDAQLDVSYNTNLSGGKFAALLFESDVLPLAVLVLAVGLEDVEALLWKLDHSNIMHEKRKVCTVTVAIRKS